MGERKLTELIEKTDEQYLLEQAQLIHGIAICLELNFKDDKITFDQLDILNDLRKLADRVAQFNKLGVNNADKKSF